MRFATWKVISIVLGSLIAVLIVLPSLLSPSMRDSLDRVLPAPARTIVLGLDLQGGAHLLLEVDAPSITKTQVDNLRDDTRRALREDNIRLTGGIGLQGRGIQFRVPDAAERAKNRPAAAQSSDLARLDADGRRAGLYGQPDR